MHTVRMSLQNKNKRDVVFVSGHTDITAAAVILPNVDPEKAVDYCSYLNGGIHPSITMTIVRELEKEE